MKQVIQSLRDGATDVIDVPVGSVSPGCLLIKSSRTLISAGTEKMLRDFGQSNLFSKARQQPDKVRLTIEKIKTDGFLATWTAVRQKLGQPIPMGYCNAGTVVAVGEGVTGFQVGDRVVSNGNHAEFVTVPVNLCAKIPEGVTFDQAAFGVLGAISLQSVRLIAPTLGEAVAVVGLGLVGLVAAQLLKANGCRVLGMDLDGQRLALARQLGIETFDLSSNSDPVLASSMFSRGRGMDAAIIATATQSDDPVRLAARMCRRRGRIVLVGVAGLSLSRADFFEKELTFQVSCSYGPGRYDPEYELKGRDYPVGYVRWTEQRNFEAVLDAISTGAVRVEPLVSHTFSIDEAPEAYKLLSSETPTLGILLRYPDVSSREQSTPFRRTTEILARAERGANKLGKRHAIAFVGAGNYSNSILMPEFKKANVVCKTVVSRAGLSGALSARRFGFELATTDLDAVLGDPEISTVVVATRHDSHADLVCRSLEAGKHVYVEKPLCINRVEHQRIRELALRLDSRGEMPILMVGYNRRFAPLTQRVTRMLEGVGVPMAVVITVNAGNLPKDHWTQDRSLGGGRMIGEACHFIDLLCCLCGTKVSEWSVCKIDDETGDTFSLSIRFAGGSIGTIHYFANGSKAYQKERLEVFCGQRILRIDNFLKLTGFGWPTFRSERLWKQDKGQRNCVTRFVDSVSNGGVAPIPLEDVLGVSDLLTQIAETSG